MKLFYWFYILTLVMNILVIFTFVTVIWLADVQLWLWLWKCYWYVTWYVYEFYVISVILVLVLAYPSFRKTRQCLQFDSLSKILMLSKYSELCACFRNIWHFILQLNALKLLIIIIINIFLILSAYLLILLHF